MIFILSRAFTQGSWPRPNSRVTQPPFGSVIGLRRKFFNPITINLRLGPRKPPSIAKKHQQDREAKPVRPALCQGRGVRCQRPVAL
jgi:hypothetical protein